MKLPAPVQRYVERIDAMTLRERLMIFLASVAVLVMLVYTGLITPLLAKQANAQARLQQQQTQLDELQARLRTLTQARTQAGNALAAKDAKVAELKARLGALNSDISAKEGQLVQPERMTTLVSDMVRRNRGVQLHSLRSLPTEEISAGGGSLYRHGIEVSVSGSYADLLAYLGEFERMPLRLSWGRLDLNAGDYPSVSLELVLTTLSTSKPWLQL